MTVICSSEFLHLIQIQHYDPNVNNIMVLKEFNYQLDSMIIVDKRFYIVFITRCLFKHEIYIVPYCVFTTIC